MKRYFLIGGILAILAIGAAVYYVWFRTPIDPAQSFKDEYSLVLSDYAGNDIELSEFRRKILVTHVWASWCPYCGEELKNLARLKEMYGEDIHIIAVNRAESLEEARAFTDSLGVTESVQLLLDPDDSFFKQVGGYAMPETIFINPKGEIFFHQRGPMQLQEIIDKINAMRE